MFRRISLAYVALALTGVALLSAFTPEPGPIHLSRLDGHVGEEVAVEALVVGAEGEEHILWQDGNTVRAYGPSELRPGDAISARALVLEGREIYLQVDRWEVVGHIEPVSAGQARDGNWVHCTGRLLEMNGSWAIADGPLLVPVAFDIDAHPIDGLRMDVEGVRHDGVVHVHDRDSISCDRFMDAPWTVPGKVEVMGVVEYEPYDTSLTLRTMDGTIRVSASEHGAHMGDLVEVRGPLDYDSRSGRFSIDGEVSVVEAHGPQSPLPEELHAEPWRFENALLQLVGNVTMGQGGPAIEMAGHSLPLRGNLTSGFGQVSGVLLSDGFRYLLDLDMADRP